MLVTGRRHPVVTAPNQVYNGNEDRKLLWLHSGLPLHVATSSGRQILKIYSNHALYLNAAACCKSVP